MNADEDEAAVLAVLNAETAAYLRKDIDALASYWVHASYARRMVSVANLGTHVYEGWDAIRANYRHLIEQFPNVYAETRVSCDRMNLVINGDTAWATYNEVGEQADDNFEMGGTLHQLKIFQRIEGQWKMACIAVMQRSIDHVSYPLIEIGSDNSVLWMNAFAHEQIANHPFLVISGGKLRTRNRRHDAGFQEAVEWAGRTLRAHWTLEPLSRLARPVILGESDDAAPLFCWVLLEDGKMLVSFNDDQMVKRRVAIAQGIYGLTPAQAQVAQLLAQGNDPSLAAEKLGISVNTVRTHIRRMFDKTGTRTQSALVGLLLSAEASTAR